LYTVVDLKVSPGLSTVDGKFGLLGESGKCCVSSVKASVCRYGLPALRLILPAGHSVIVAH